MATLKFPLHCNKGERFYYSGPGRIVWLVTSKQGKGKSLTFFFSVLLHPGTSYPLKVHKIENFFDSDFGICVISLLFMSKYKDFTKNFFDWAIIGGGTIFPRSPRTTGNEKKF
jgi:hypothetical protein